MRAVGLPARPHHPTAPHRLGNLACLHCYSESDSRHKGWTSTRCSSGEALEVLRAEGYAVVSLAGGEPLVYKRSARSSSGVAREC